MHCPHCGYPIPAELVAHVLGTKRETDQQDYDASRMQRAAEVTFAENEARRRAMDEEPVAPMPADVRRSLTATRLPE